MYGGSGIGLPRRGARLSIAASWGDNRSSSPVRRSARSSPVACRARKRPAQQPQPPRVGEQREHQPAQGPVLRGAVVAALDLGPGLLDQGVVLHPRGAGGHARHAAQAGVPVRHHRVAHRLALEALLHQVDPAPGGVHLLPPQHVGGARRQAEAAVHAVTDQRRVRRVVVVEGAPGGRYARGRRCCPSRPRRRRLLADRSSQIPPTKRPGASRWSGSNWSFTRRIRSRAGTGPHTSTPAFTEAGASTTTALPPTRVQA